MSWISSGRARCGGVVLVLSAGLAGCGEDRALLGREILDRLDRERIPVPDEAGDEPRVALAELPASGPISLADLLAVGEARSPELAAARSEVGSATGELWQASRYPNPSVDVRSEDVSFEDGVSSATTTVGITQPIVIGGRLGAARRAAEAEVAARRARVEECRRELLGNIAEAHARLLAIREQRALHQELREQAERTLSAASERFDARAAPETDVIRPRVEVHRLDAALGRLASQERAVQRRLSLLLGGVEVDAARVDGVVELAPKPIDAAHVEGLLEAHPALALADREIESAMASLERERAGATPDLGVRLGVGYNGERDDGVVEIGAGMTVPLWDAREGAVLGGRFELMRARQRRRAIELELRGRLAEAIGEHEAARTQLETFRERIVPDARRAFDQTAEAYRAGRASFLELLDAQRTLSEARVAMVELAGSASEARARVLRVVGPDGLWFLVGRLSEPTPLVGDAEESARSANPPPSGSWWVTDPPSNSAPRGAEVIP